MYETNDVIKMLIQGYKGHKYMDEHQRNQYRHEIQWIENRIVKLASKLANKPSKQREIDDLRRQIRERQYQIDFGV